jgi:hypothetical protein
MVAAGVGGRINTDTTKNRQRRFIGRKVREVLALRASSGSFALERRAQDDSKNKQKQEQAPTIRRFWLREKDEWSGG